MTDSGTSVAVFGVVIADHKTITHALVGLLDDHPGLQVVGIAANGEEATELCEALKPHIAVLEFMMPFGGTQVLAAVRKVSPETEVVFYTGRADSRTHARLLQGGAAAIFVKGVANDLAAEIHKVARKQFPNHLTQNGISK